MGQYYRAAMEIDGEISIYDPWKYNSGAKLTEHSWAYNPMILDVMADLYQYGKPACIWWVGDYTCDEEGFDDDSELQSVYFACWGKFCKKPDEPRKKEEQLEKEFFDDKYLVNDSRKIAVHLGQYFRENVDLKGEGWCTSPISLLTATCNHSGGHYGGINQDDIGTWCGDEISIRDAVPDGFHEVMYHFWESFLH